MEREKKLAKNIVIFAIGSFSSKLLQFLLIPFYTRVLSNSEYGTIDILQNIATLLIPIISLTISEAVFRYAMDKNSNKKEVLSIGIIISIIGTVAILIISAIIFKITQYEYVLVLAFYIITNIIRTIISQFTRAINRVAMYTADNVLNVLITVLCNILFLTVLHLGINGYLMGYIVGNSVSIAFLFITIKIHKYISFKEIKKDTVKGMLRFSIPLIPNSICWWITNFTDRVMIIAFYGTAENGLYAVSHKIPTVVTIVVDVFFQAWQISANKEFDQKDISNFYSNIFKYLFAFVFVICATIMSFSQIITKIIVGQEFIESWKYMPTILLGTAFFTMAQYLGSVYTASKNTKMAFVTNITAAILNIFLNIVFLKYIGTIGAAVATAICYLFLWIYRMKNTKKIVNIQYDIPRIISTVLLLIINSVIVTTQITFWYIYTTIIILLIIAINRECIINLIKTTVTLIKEKTLIKKKV